jgi:hypothetical protein
MPKQTKKTQQDDNFPIPPLPRKLERKKAKLLRECERLMAEILELRGAVVAATDAHAPPEQVAVLRERAAVALYKHQLVVRKADKHVRRVTQAAVRAFLK